MLFLCLKKTLIRLIILYNSRTSNDQNIKNAKTN